MEEKKLLDKLKKFDSDAFEILMQQNEKKIYNYALAYTKNSDDAADVTQETFLRFINNMHRFRGESSISTYLFKIAVNLCKDIVIKNAKNNTVPLLYDDEKPLLIEDITQDVFEKVMESITKDIIYDAISSLSYEHREIFILRDVSGLEYVQISQLLGIETGTVKSRLFRARESLKNILCKNGNFFEKKESKQCKEAQSK